VVRIAAILADEMAVEANLLMFHCRIAAQGIEFLTVR